MLHFLACYVIYHLVFILSSNVDQEYKKRHNGHGTSIQPNDIAFSIHVRDANSCLLLFELIHPFSLQAALIGVVLLAQSFVYPGDHGQRLSKFIYPLISIYGVLFLVGLIMCSVSGFPQLIDLLFTLSYFDLYTSSVGCVYQVNPVSGFDKLKLESKPDQCSAAT